jgi:uncharacterized protein (DUF433 family)
LGDSLRYLFEGAMALEITYPHVEKSGDEPAHLARVPRVRVAQIALDYLAYGWSADEMCRQHPYLKPAEAHAAMTYYFDHAEEIDAEIRAEVEYVDSLRKGDDGSPLRTRLRA